MPGAFTLQIEKAPKFGYNSRVSGASSAAADKALIDKEMFTVYVLISQINKLRYVGQTSNLEKRLLDHNSGESRYTKGRGPWVLVYEEKYSTRSEAMQREKFLKTGKGRDFLDKIVKV